MCADDGSDLYRYTTWQAEKRRRRRLRQLRDLDSYTQVMTSGRLIDLCFAVPSSIAHGRHPADECSPAGHALCAVLGTSGRRGDAVGFLRASCVPLAIEFVHRCNHCEPWMAPSCAACFHHSENSLHVVERAEAGKWVPAKGTRIVLFPPPSPCSHCGVMRAVSEADDDTHHRTKKLEGVELVHSTPFHGAYHWGDNDCLQAPRLWMCGQSSSVQSATH